MKIFIINYAFISGIAKKNIPILKLSFTGNPSWEKFNIITKGYSSIRISVHAEQHRVENSHGPYIIEEISDRFYYIIQEVRCPLIAEVQRRVYIDKQNKELIEQNGLLFEAEFNNEVGVTRYKNRTKVVQVCYLIFTYFLMNSKKCTKITKKRENHEHIELDDFSYVSPQIYFYHVTWYHHVVCN